MRILTTIFLAVIVTSSHAASDDERLDRLEQRLSSKAFMNMWRSVDQLRNEMRDLRGEIEQQSFEMQKIRQQQKKQYIDLDQRLQTIEKAAAVRATINQDKLETTDQQLTRDPVQSPQPNQSLLSNVPTNADAEIISADYDKALQTLREGRYAESAQLFKQIVNRYPNSDYADNAQYWLAETKYINRDFDAATMIFQQLSIIIRPAQKYQTPCSRSHLSNLNWMILIKSNNN